jgi:hypothetical protein
MTASHDMPLSSEQWPAGHRSHTGTWHTGQTGRGQIFCSTRESALGRAVQLASIGGPLRLKHEIISYEEVLAHVQRP